MLYLSSVNITWIDRHFFSRVVVWCWLCSLLEKEERNNGSSSMIPTVPAHVYTSRCCPNHNHPPFTRHHAPGDVGSIETLHLTSKHVQQCNYTHLKPERYYTGAPMLSMHKYPLVPIRSKSSLQWQFKKGIPNKNIAITIDSFYIVQCWWRKRISITIISRMVSLCIDMAFLFSSRNNWLYIPCCIPPATC